MSAVMRSALSVGVAAAAVGAIALSPPAAAPAVHLPVVQAPAIALTAAPALGAIPYQILVNLLGDGVALTPILVGGIGQCTVCIGPVSPPSPVPSPFTGWGALGIGFGLISSPLAIIGAVQAGQSITQALGVGLLAIQLPIDNTAALLAAPRLTYGGYEFAATRARAAQAVTDTIVGTLGVTEQILTGVRAIISATLVGITAFAQTLATTGDVITAFNAGLAPISASAQTAVSNTVSAIQTLRETVYADLTSGPGPGTHPIPTVSAATAATAAADSANRRPAVAAATISRLAAVLRPDAGVADDSNLHRPGQADVADAGTGGNDRGVLHDRQHRRHRP